MCSSVESLFPTEELSGSVSKDIDLASATCQKCKSKRAVMCLRRKDVYCKDCFINASLHKFRSTLGKHKVLRPKDKVLVGFNGSISSLSLLHLNSMGLNESNRKRLLFDTSVLVIDDCGLADDAQKRSDLIQDTISLGKQYPFPVYVVSLEKSIQPSVTVSDITAISDNEYHIPDDETQELFRRFVKGAKESSSQEYIFRSLKAQLLAACAQALGHNCVFTAEDSSSLAITIMTGIASGRGAQLPFEAGFRDTRHCVALLRPMREFSTEEIEMYHKWQSLAPPRTTQSMLSKPASSIDMVTKKFIHDLQDNFPATVPTVFRTADKFQSTCGQATMSDEYAQCLLCCGVLDVSLSSSVPSAVEATEFSQLVSHNGPNKMTDVDLVSDVLRHWTIDSDKSENEESVTACDTPSESCGTGLCAEGGSCHSTNSGLALSREDLLPYLCYSCRRISQGIEPIPEFLVQRAARHIRRSQAKEAIKDFLL